MEHNLPENTSNNIYESGANEIRECIIIVNFYSTGSIVIYLLTFKETVYTESFLM